MKFLITTLTSWDEIPRARHQVAEELIRAGHKVIFVEKNRVGFFRLDARAIKPGLTLLTPFFPIDYRFRFRLPGINEIYQLWLFPLLRKRVGDRWVINFDFTAYLLGRIFTNTVYYCNDEYIGNSKYPVWVINRYHQWVEKRTAASARFCVGTADPLAEKLSRWNPAVYKIPLGGPNPDDLNVDRCFSRQGKIRVGLMGAIKLGHVSADLCNKIVEQSDMELVFVGNVDAALLQRLNAPERIQMKGVLVGDALYHEMALFDVAIAPYDVEGINAGVTPNKLFQYLACACPAVITDIPNIQGVEYPAGTVYVAGDEEEFTAMIRKACEEDCPVYSKARQQLAADNTWEKRIQGFLARLSEHGLVESEG